MELGSFTAAFDAGRQGMASGVARMTRAAEVLSHDVDPTAMIDLKLANLQTRASATVIRSVDDALGTMLDALA